MRPKKSSAAAASIGLGVLLGLSHASHAAHPGHFNHKPHFIKGTVHHAYYDGLSDDLLTAGLGVGGIAGTAPPVADPTQPTAAELRRLAIYNNYRALVDVSSGGGFGRLYGPNIKADGSDGQGLISGHEYLAYADNGRGRRNVTLMVQVPDSFNPEEPCIVTAPSSGSRGVYGAIGTAGDWGLKNGCAVAYTDKGTGTGAHNLQDDTVTLIDGTRVSATTAGQESHFTARLTESRRNDFNAATPNRYAVKHAHSQKNPEAQWGRNVLQSVKFAFYLLNELHGAEGPGGKKLKNITPGNTIVIASSVSNGGGSSLRAAEQDRHGLIDGVAVSEPNVNPRYDAGFTIVQGNGTPLRDHSRSLLDYTSLLAIYQGCANGAASNAGAPFNFVNGDNVCASLHAKGLLSSTNLADQAEEAQQIINNYGVLSEQNRLQPSHWFVNVPQAITMAYANTYGRFSVARNLCGFSYGAVDATGVPTPLDPAAEALLFGTSNGIPPTGGVDLINNNAVGGPTQYRLAISPGSATQDQSLDNLLCLRGLTTSHDPVSNKPLRGMDLWNSWRVRFGISQVRAKGDLNGKPAVIVTGRNDAILPPNHTSRAYYGLNQRKEGNGSRLRYYEITNAHHLDAFNAFPGFNDHYIPLHHYFIQAMDMMFDHLRNGTPLPPSQVIHTTPRGSNGGSVPDLTLAHLPAIDSNPSNSTRITFTGNQVHIPD